MSQSNAGHLCEILNHHSEQTPVNSKKSDFPINLRKLGPSRACKVKKRAETNVRSMIII